MENQQRERTDNFTLQIYPFILPGQGYYVVKSKIPADTPNIAEDLLKRMLAEGVNSAVRVNMRRLGDSPHWRGSARRIN